MSTFVVRFLGDALRSFQGIVRHVATGEELLFGSPAELIGFMDQMNAVTGVIGETPTDSAAPSATPKRRT